MGFQVVSIVKEYFLSGDAQEAAQSLQVGFLETSATLPTLVEVACACTVKERGRKSCCLEKSVSPCSYEHASELLLVKNEHFFLVGHD